jgi:hypothetical protein
MDQSQQLEEQSRAEAWTRKGEGSRQRLPVHAQFGQGT